MEEFNARIALAQKDGAKILCDHRDSVYSYMHALYVTTDIRACISTPTLHIFLQLYCKCLMFRTSLRNIYTTIWQQREKLAHDQKMSRSIKGNKDFMDQWPHGCQLNFPLPIKSQHLNQIKSTVCNRFLKTWLMEQNTNMYFLSLA